MMITQKFPSSFLRTGLMTFLLLMISNATFTDITVTTEQDLSHHTPNEIAMEEAVMILETKVSFLNESIGDTIRESNDLHLELNALQKKLETSQCKDTNIIPVKLNEVSAICLFPEGFCEMNPSLIFSDLNDVDEKLLPYLVCFIEPSTSDNRMKQLLLRRISNADKRKINATLLKANDEMLSSEKRNQMKNFLSMLPRNVILNADVLIKRQNSDKSSTASTSTNRLVTRRKSGWPFRTTTAMKRATEKPKEDPKEKSKQELLQKFLNGNDTLELPDLSIFNKVPFQRLLKMPRQRLCSLLPKFPATNLSQVKKIIIYKQCQEELQKIAATIPKKLGKLLSLLKSKDIINLNNDQLQNLAVAVCQYESLVNAKMTRLLAKMVLPVGEFEREENQIKFLKEASCLLKYIKPSDLRQIKLSNENKKFFCKRIGASHLNKLREGEARNLTKYCMKGVLRDKMELSELGNLLNYVMLSDIRNVTESQLLSWASVLQHFLDNDEEIQYTGRKLNKMYKDKLSDMTAEDLEKVGVLVGSWDSKDRRKIPSESWAQSLQSFVSTCQKMDIENNNNFKFCYKIIPYVLKARDRTQFKSDDAFTRIRRETQKPAPLTCKNITEIKSLVKTLTVEQIKSISKEEFFKCIQVFGKVTNYTSEQLQNLMPLVNMTFGNAKNWSAETITELGTLLATLSSNQIKYMNFSNTNIVENLGKFSGFMKQQVTQLFGNWLNTTKLGNIAKINLTDIQLIGNLLCGISKAGLQKISPQVIMDAVEDIGKLDSCNITEQQMLLDKVLDSIQEMGSLWTPELLTSLGPLIRLLNETTIEKLTVSDLENVSAELIDQIPILQAAAIKEIILPQLNSLVNVSEVKMLVTILCETKNVTNLKSLTNAIQSLTQNNLTCTPKDRDMYLKKLLNSSSASVLDIFKQIIKNVSSLIEKPPRSSLAKFTREQITSIIDAVVQKIPTVHLDDLFNKWLKDQKIRTLESTPLDQEMLALLACGLDFDFENTDQIDGDYILKALNFEKVSFSCTEDEQKQWLVKNFKFAADMLQTLVKSNGIEIDSIMGIVKNVGFPSKTSQQYLEKELLRKAGIFQTNSKLGKLMLGVINATETYFGNASVLELTSTLCRINVTDITKIDENLLRKFFARQYKQCSPSEERAWLAAVINSAMHNLIKMNATQLQSLMTELESLLNLNMTSSGITEMVTDITHLEVNELLKMLLIIMKNDSSLPELTALKEISTCLEKLDKSELKTLSPVAKLKYWIDKCVKPLRGLEKLMNSTSMKLANMVIGYLHPMKSMFRQLDVLEMLKEWKLYETISSLPLEDVSAMTATFEEWLKELRLSNITVHISPKHVLLSFLACNLELDANNFEIMPKNIKKAVEKFVQGEPCSPEKQKTWLSENFRIISRVVNNFADILKDMTNHEGKNKPDADIGDKKDDDSGNVSKDADNNNNNDTSTEKDDSSGDEDIKDKNGTMVEREKMENKTEIKDGGSDKGKDVNDGMQGDQPKNDDKTNDKGDTDKKPNPVTFGGGSTKDRTNVKDDFPFSDKILKKEVNEEFVKKLWDFKRSSTSQKEARLLKKATEIVIKYLLKNDKILKEYLAKNKSRVMELAGKVNMRRAFLAKTKVDQEFLSTVSSVDSESEAQAILVAAMKNIGNKTKKDFIKSLSPELIKKSGTLAMSMLNEDTKGAVIQLFKPKTETKTVTRAQKKAERKKMSLAELVFAKKTMTNKPDTDTVKLVLRSSLLSAIPATQFNEISNDVLCNKNIAINELEMDQVLTMIKKCSSMIKGALKTDPEKLGILTVKVTKDMFNELGANEAAKVIQVMCNHERDLNIDVAKSLFSLLKEKKVNVIKDSDKAGCLVKYATNEFKDFDVKSDLETAKDVCKNIGNSMNEKMSKESGKMFKDQCFKIVVDSKLSFQEFGNLIHFLDVADIKKLKEDQLIEAAQILSLSVQNKLVFEEISNSLKKIPSLSNPATLTADNITIISIFIGAWDDIDKIPKANIELASLILTETMKTQMLLKKSCMAEKNDISACSEIDQYLKKIVQVLMPEQTKVRRRRRSTTACNCELPSKLGTAAEMISPESLKEMLCKDNFLTCMEKLSVVKSWTANHQAVFAEIAKNFQGSPTSNKWSESTLKSVVPAIPGLSAVEIGSLDLNTLDLAFALGNQITWKSDQLKATFDVVYKNLLNSNNSYITSLELQTFRNLLCGMDTNIIGAIKSEEYLAAARELGNIDCFTNEQHKLWVKKAMDVYQDVKKWSDSTIASMGAVISGLSAEDLQKLTSTQVIAILPDIIPKIAAESLKNFHPDQFRYMTTSQVQKITAAQRSKLNSEQINIIEEKLKYTDSFQKKNNSDGSHSILNIAVIIFSILLLILY